MPTIPIPYHIRNRHLYIVGKTQHGKSTLLYSIISQDIENGAGVCVIDPKPSAEKPNLVDTVLQHIPESRKDDVIYFDAANPIPIDIMSWATEQERQTLAADLMLTFMQFVSQKDGDRWPGILRYAIHAILDAGGCTFLDIHDFLAYQSHREAILARVKRPQLLKYWREIYPLFPKDAAVPILNRMAAFILVPPLSVMLGTVNPPLSLEQAIRQRKILLINLTGAGKESGNLIGTLFVSRIQQAVFRHLGAPLHLFADEFQNFQTSAFDVILSEAGGLDLRITLANQYVHQLEERIRQSVFGNVSSFFVFNVDDADTYYFKGKMPNDIDDMHIMNHECLAHQPPYMALYAIAGEKNVFKPIPRPPAPPAPADLERAAYIMKRTLDLYSCKPQPKPHNPVDVIPDPEPAVAPAPHHAGGPSAADVAFRAQEQGRRRARQKKTADTKRHQDDKPEP